MGIGIGLIELIILGVLLFGAIGLVVVLASRGGGSRRPDIE
jgi:hypothetical protein